MKIYLGKYKGWFRYISFKSKNQSPWIMIWEVDDPYNPSSGYVLWSTK